MTCGKTGEYLITKWQSEMIFAYLNTDIWNLIGNCLFKKLVISMIRMETGCGEKGGNREKWCQGLRVHWEVNSQLHYWESEVGKGILCIIHAAESC